MGLLDVASWQPTVYFSMLPGQCYYQRCAVGTQKLRLRLLDFSNSDSVTKARYALITVNL
jgi:hypothetical protein